MLLARIFILVKMEQVKLSVYTGVYLTAALALDALSFCMFKRARTCGVIAFLAAIFGFTGLLEATAGLAQAACYLFAAAALLSCLFGLFECASETDPEGSQAQLSHN
jgi:uncharacterized membrane protein YtjA (UPF0391 family)